MKEEKRETSIDAPPVGFGTPLARIVPIDPGVGFETSFPSPPTLAEASEEIKKVAEVIGDSAVYVLARSDGKTCSKCGDFKPLEAFHLAKAHEGGRDARCKACKSRARGKRYQRDAAKEATAATEWKRRNPIRARVQRLKHYSAIRGRDVDGEATGDRGDLTADEWEEILESYRTIDGGGRVRFQCAYCGARKRRIDLQIDHVLALSRGGRNTRTNVVPACGACNAGKRDRDLRPTLPSPHLAAPSATSPEAERDSIEPAEVAADAFSFP